ncbi:erythroid differentiation-related factor 1 [Ischnura elegans]|uniref:erythroid differentiation-related factor 1 n=1 Tax=Ischnura elegans TaxID=197161 RepID=UPI001ED88EDB|nr:erythroid differentiation-related factor 1 [Ischnura elegans]
MDQKSPQDSRESGLRKDSLCDNSREEEEKRLSDGESSSVEMHLHPIKSTAVVKYSASESPAHFAKLQCNTDLNMPPSNWLSSAAEPYGLHYFPSHSTGFSSFKMAHMFPDCVGEVDVVSDAENIKKLLKIPYSRGPVSMMVHRIENTLLIDEFDIHKHLLITAKKEWEWLKNFFFNHVLASLDDKEKGLLYRNRARGAVQQRSLVSKFLFHSLAAGPETIPGNKDVDVKKTSYENVKGNEEASGPAFTSASKDSPPLPEPREEEAVPDAVSSHNFTRNVVWTFEDIQMLIGTDMPIFGGSTHPCISLRLREMTRPINVLTGIDYWLDNLMCNVPEVVMCYHLAGIVQRYELIKTEDLPHLPNSKFSPKLIRDVAQNILSFLKSNATKAGHTYWLFRGKDDDIVKLYDLTSLCTDILDDRGQNPFTVPVGMLLYRVARNMKNPKPNKRQQATIQTLLKNCLTLLAKEKYPRIVASAHYMLSDLYVPTKMDTASPNPSPKNVEKDDEAAANSQSEEEAAKDEEMDEKDGTVLSPLSKTQNDCLERKVAVQSLCVSKRSSRWERHKRSRSVKHGAASFNENMSTKDRCLLAMGHIMAGLSCLQYLKPGAPSSEKDEEHGSAKETSSGTPKKRFNEEEPKMARPCQAIPMPYSRLSDNSTGSEGAPKGKGQGKVVDGNIEQKKGDGGEPWGEILKGLLIEKAGLVFATLTDVENQMGRFGSSLRMVVRTLQCCRILEGLRGENVKGGRGGVGRKKGTGEGVNGRWEDIDEMRGRVLGMAGDAAFMIVKQWRELERLEADFVGSLSDAEAEVGAFLEEDLPSTDSSETGSPLALREEWKNNTTSEQELITFFGKAFNGSIEEMLLVSCCCYQLAFSLTKSSTRSKSSRRQSNPSVADAQRDMLLQRLGNIHNELGVLYNGKFEANLLKEESVTDRITTKNVPLSLLTMKELACLSGEHFEAGIKAFGFVQDKQNMSLLHSNLGRLMQLQAHRAGMAARSAGLIQVEKRFSLLKQEKIFYNKAIESYQRALDVLDSREEHPEIWDAVASGLSSALFNYATHLNDPHNRQGAKASDDSEEIIEAFRRALKSCEIESDDIRSPLYQYRAALIHHRLAVKFTEKFRALTSEGLDDHFKHHKRKGGGKGLDRGRGSAALRVLQMANEHYEKATQLLLDVENPTEFLRVLVERLALEEYLLSGGDYKVQITRLCDAVKLVIGCKKILEILVERNEKKDDDAVKVDCKDEHPTVEAVKSETADNSQAVHGESVKGEESQVGSQAPSSVRSADSESSEASDESGDSLEEQLEILELIQCIKGKLQSHLLKLVQLGTLHYKPLVEPIKRMYRLAIQVDLDKTDVLKKPAEKIVVLSSKLGELVTSLEEEMMRIDFANLE